MDNYIKQYRGSPVDAEVMYIGNFLFLHAKGRVLDLGCGPALHVWASFMVGAKQIVGVDIVPESIEVYRHEIRHLENYAPYQEMIRHEFTIPSYDLERQKAKISEVRLFDFTKPLPFPPESFDVVMFSYSLGCLKTIKDLDNALQNAHHVLKPKGLMISMSTNGNNSNEIIPEYTWQGLAETPLMLLKQVRSNGYGSMRFYSKHITNSGVYKYDRVFIITGEKTAQINHKKRRISSDYSR